MKFRRVPAWLSLALWLLWAVAAVDAQTLPRGEELLGHFPWEKQGTGFPPVFPGNGQLFDAPPGIGGKVLKISNPSDGPLMTTVLTVSNPLITTDIYGLRAYVRYSDVVGNAYLEMWNSFPGGGSYFSRTLGDAPGDPMAKISGTSDWRPILLPFNSTGASAHPARLVVNVVLPGRGTVYLSELQLFQVRSGQSAFMRRTFGGFAWMHTVLIVAMFFLSSMARRERHRALVLAGAWTLTALTVALLMVSILQAYKLELSPWEWALRLTVGVFISGMFAACAWMIRRRYHRAEWRRMTALDA